MKKSLLIAIIIALGFNANAQRVPLFENFDNGLPPGWTTVSAAIGTYERLVNGNCTANQGIVTSPSIGSGGSNKTGFKTAPLQSVDANSIVTVRFEGYVYKGPQLRCQDQLFGITCTGTAKIYITSAATGDTLGNSEEIALNFTTGINTLTAQVNANVAPSTDFVVLLDISQVNCNINGSFRLVIDNVFIAATRGALPVYFKSFHAKRSSGQNVLVSWTTATEQNSSGFYVQRNTNGRWEILGFVATKSFNGNSNVDLSYSFTDLNNFKGISQYRIVQVDINGAQKISEVSIVRGEQNGGGVTVFPNPSFDGNATILFEDQTSARDIAIIDLTGRVVKQWINVNNNNLKIDKLAPGYYSIRIYNRSTREQVVEKIIVNNK